MVENSFPAVLMAFLLCLITLHPMMRLGILDHPVRRSAHTTPVPKGGGIAILTGVTGGMILLDVFPSHRAPSTALCPEIYLLAAILLLGSISWWDDLHPFPARYKLLTQGIASAIAAWGLHPTLLPFLLMILVGLVLTNALNFIDGLNGLAPGVMMFSAFFMAGNDPQPGVFLLLASSLLAFLPFNFPKARIFMGDAGSQPCALILAWGGMKQLNESAANSHAPLLLPFLLTGILWDVSFTLIRRIIARESLSQAHRGHLYQLAVRAGWPASFVSILHWGFVFWGEICALYRPENGLDILLLLLPQGVWTCAVICKARTSISECW